GVVGDRALDLAEVRDRVGEAEVAPLGDDVGVRRIDGVGDRRGGGDGGGGEEAGGEDAAGKAVDGHGMAPMRLCGGTVPCPKAPARRTAYPADFVLPDHNAELKITFLDRRAQFGGFGLLGCAVVPLALFISQMEQCLDIDTVSRPK